MNGIGTSNLLKDTISFGIQIHQHDGTGVWETTDGKIDFDKLKEIEYNIYKERSKIEKERCKVERRKCENIVEYNLLKARMKEAGLFVSEMPNQMIILHLSDENELSPIGIPKVMKDPTENFKLEQVARELKAFGSICQNGITMKPIFDKDFYKVGAPIQVTGKDNVGLDFNESCLIKWVKDTEMNVVYVTKRGVLTEARIHLKDVESNKTKITLL